MAFGNPSLEQLLGGVIALLVGLTFHEFSHALVADTLGDRRPRAMGRLTLNPVPHIDPLGAVMLMIAGFGWAKPVQVNPSALRNGPAGFALVAAAGPVANVIVAVIAAVLFRVLAIGGVEASFVGQVLAWVVWLNLVLAIFNLLPIPPLDGYNVALALLPPRQAMWLRMNARYGMIVLLGLIVLSYLRSPIDPLGWIFAIADAVGSALIGA